MQHELSRLWRTYISAGTEVDRGPSSPALAKRARVGGEEPESLLRWLRFGWLPLVGGCVAIALATMIGWELVTRTFAPGPEIWADRVSFLSRAVVAAVLMAIWAGFYVLYARNRIRAVYDRLRLSEIALAERGWRAEQSFGMGALSRILAHEIRNPLNGMTLNGALLRRKLARMPGGEELVPLVDILSGETSRLSKLVDDYLAYTQTKRIELALETVNLPALARELLDEQRAALEAANVEVEVIEADALPTVSADLAKLRQILHNLLRNAVEAMPAGGRVRIAIRRDDAALVLSVSDDGPGFEDPESVLRPFYTTKAEGSGLGLAIVRDIVRAHGGEIQARNLSPKGGADVLVRLPLREGKR